MRSTVPERLEVCAPVSAAAVSPPRTCTSAGVPAVDVDVFDGCSEHRAGQLRREGDGLASRWRCTQSDTAVPPDRRAPKIAHLRHSTAPDHELVTGDALRSSDKAPWRINGWCALQGTRSAANCKSCRLTMRIDDTPSVVEAQASRDGAGRSLPRTGSLRPSPKRSMSAGCARRPHQEDEHPGTRSGDAFVRIVPKEALMSGMSKQKAPRLGREARGFQRSGRMGRVSRGR